MENYVSEQLLLFFRAIGLGAALALVYDLLGTLRYLGGRLLGSALDVLFCLIAALACFFFIMAGDGELRIFMVLGIIGGGILFFCLISPLLRPVWTFWMGLLLFPIRLLGRFLKKCGQTGKKLFSFCRNWFTINLNKLPKQRTAQKQEGGQGDGKTSCKENGAADRPKTAGQ